MGDSSTLKGTDARGGAGRSIPFRKLTPARSPDVIAPYKSAFDFVFEHDDLRNIAVAGPYGSGKSSVVESLKEDPEYSSEHRFMTVSIAHFRGLPTNDAPASSKKAACPLELSVVTPDASQQSDGTGGRYETARSVEQELEGQILNRLIHLTAGSSLPRSRFRKTSDAGIGTLVIAFAVTALALSAVFLMFNLGGVLYRIPRDVASMAQAVSVAFVILLTGMAVALLTRRLDLFRVLRRISVHGNEIELFDRSTDSMFDRYLDDILYILERCDEDVILFEDIDRFGNDEIFEKLRELNQLANEARTRKRSAEARKRHQSGHGSVGASSRTKPLRFLYMVRDDMFVPADRVKFFDFIITVIPYVDSTNSGDELVRALEGEGFDAGFLYELSLYIDDARVLNNMVTSTSSIRRSCSGAAACARGIARGYSRSSRTRTFSPQTTRFSTLIAGIFTACSPSRTS